MQNSESDKKEGWIAWLINLFFKPSENSEDKTLTEKDVLIGKIITILQKNHPDKLFFFYSTSTLSTKSIYELKHILKEFEEE